MKSPAGKNTLRRGKTFWRRQLQTLKVTSFALAGSFKRALLQKTDDTADSGSFLQEVDLLFFLAQPFDEGVLVLAFTQNPNFFIQRQIPIEIGFVSDAELICMDAAPGFAVSKAFNSIGLSMSSERAIADCSAILTPSSSVARSDRTRLD